MMMTKNGDTNNPTHKEYKSFLCYDNQTNDDDLEQKLFPGERSQELLPNNSLLVSHGEIIGALLIVSLTGVVS